MLLFLGIHLAMAESKVIVWQRNGTSIEFSYDARPQISYNGNNLVLTTTDNVISYSLSQVRKVTFDYDQTEGTEQVATPTSFRIQDGRIVVSGSESDALLHIYRMDGSQLGTYRLDGSGGTTIDISIYPPSTYLLKVENITYKFQKR